MNAENVKWQVNLAVRRSNLPPAARLIMFVLSDRADAKTGVIPDKHSPSLAELAEDTGYGESTVKTQLLDLERLGWVTRLRPDASQRARHISTRYRIQVGDAGERREPAKRKPRARSGPSQKGPEGQEMAPETESEGQEMAHRGPGVNDSRARSWPSYIEDDDLTIVNDQKPPADQAAEGTAPAKPKRKRKPREPKPPNPVAEAAQELTVAFFEHHRADNMQPFVAIRGIVKTALERGVPRNVLAFALDNLANAGVGISGHTLTSELGRMRAESQPGTSRTAGRFPSRSNDQHLADEMAWALQLEAEEAARQEPNPWEEIAA